jgi:hypothetical protein
MKDKIKKFYNDRKEYFEALGYYTIGVVAGGSAVYLAARQAARGNAIADIRMYSTDEGSKFLKVDRQNGNHQIYVWQDNPEN